jgi:hypothetical protein
MATTSTTTTSIDSTSPDRLFPPQDGIPFGAYALLPAQYGEGFTATQITVSPSSIVATLSGLRAAGMRASISLAGFSKDNYQNQDGTFNTQMWRDRVERFVAVDFSEFIQDGTIIAHALIDDLSDSHWGGRAISNQEIDELARYSKELWPEMLTVVRSRATKLVTPGYGGSGTPFEWQHLDGAWDQYSSRMGPVAAQLQTEVTSASEQGLGLVVGLNVLTGGNGSSGISGPGEYSHKWAMSADELREYGAVLIGHPYACAFLMWSAKYDYGERHSHLGYRYFERPEIREALAHLRDLASQRASVPCARH